jgi:antitoxin (DNA-binding transcriptional repressor) of toxin-antitoxin stability system
VAAATPSLRALRLLDGLCALLEEAARRRLDALPLPAVVAQIAAMEAGEQLALTRHRRPRLVPSAEPPAAAVAEHIVQMSAEELRELERRLRERLVPASAKV